MTTLKYIGTWEELEKRGFEKQKDKYEKKIDGNWWELLDIYMDERDIVKFTEEIGHWTFLDDYELLQYEKDIKSLMKDGLVIKEEVE